MGLLHGTAPHAMVLCHQAGRTAIEEPPYTKLPGLSEMVTAYESAAATVRPARVACIALNCQGMSRSDGRDLMAEIEDETGLPVGDVWAGDAEKLWAATVAALPARKKAVAAH